MRIDGSSVDPVLPESSWYELVDLTPDEAEIVARYNIKTQAQQAADLYPVMNKIESLVAAED